MKKEKKYVPWQVWVALTWVGAALVEYIGLRWMAHKLHVPWPLW